MSSNAAAPRPGTEPSFEQEMHRLQHIVSQLENGDLSLEATIVAFQQGSELVTRCQRLIADAELRITKLADASTASDEGASVSANGDFHRQLPGL